MRYSIGFVIKIFVMIQFFSAAKLFNSLLCRFLSVHHFANETLLQKFFFLKLKTKNWQQENVKSDNFHKHFLWEVMHDFFGGFKFVGVLFKFFYKIFSKGASLNFLPKLLPGETLCKLCQIFPPKDLVYIGRKHSVTHLVS